MGIIRELDKEFLIYSYPIYTTCYELKPLELGKRTNSCIGVNTRELNRDFFTN